MTKEMQLAPGVELIGEYEGSGFKEPRYIARRADAQIVQMPRLVYLVASHLDGRDLDEVARSVGHDLGRPVSAENVEYLIDNKLIPAGLVIDPNAAPTRLNRSVPLLALRFRARVVPARIVNAITFLFQPFFWPPVIALVLAALVGVDVWLFAAHGIGESVRELLFEPQLILVIFGLVVLSAIFHEFGHATACRYGGARPGAMGMGIYIVWPAFFTDVTDAYRLDRRGRLRTDLGGIYFNAISMVVIAAVYFATGFEALLVAIALQHVEVIHQLLPFLRLDGYYIVSDLTGIPDLFARTRPALASLVPWRKADAKVTELRPVARAVLIVWVLLLIPVVGSIFVLIALAAPGLVSTAAASISGLFQDLVSSTQAGRFTDASIATLQILALGLPLAGIALTFGRLSYRAGSTAWRVSGANRLQGALTVAALSSVGVILLSGALWTDRVLVEASEGLAGSDAPATTAARSSGVATGGVPLSAEVLVQSAVLRDAEGLVPAAVASPDPSASTASSDGGPTTGSSAPSGAGEPSPSASPSEEPTPTSSSSQEPSPSPSP